MTQRPDFLSQPKYVIYGGAFDPPHVGHVGCVEKILDRFPEAHVIVTPTPHPPRTAHGTKGVCSPFDARSSMCRHAFQDLGARVEVSEIEASLPPPQYTVSTLRTLEKRLPGPFGLMIGQDQLEQFPLWREPLEILKRASLVIIARPRDGETSSNLGNQEGQLLEAVRKIAEKLELNAEWLEDSREARLLAPKDGWSASIFFLPGSVGAFSSSHIREQLSRQEVETIVGIPKNVARFIREHGLYQQVKFKTNAKDL
jgi:nicotinate (nicotinamide) nucleotide adenylyltransferase